MTFSSVDVSPSRYTVGGVAKASLIVLIAIMVIAILRHTRIPSEPAHTTPPSRPNYIIFLADDMGWSDLPCYGHPTQHAPHLCKLATEGVRYTQWYAPDSVCTPSRGALLTGRMPSRIGLVPESNSSAPHTYRVLWDHSKTGLPHSEITIAEALKGAGYSTGLVGKWHLGVNAHNRSDGTYLPTTQGFDFVGHNLPFTHHWMCDESKLHMPQGPLAQKCYLYYGDKLKQQPYHTHNLTSALVKDSIDFIRAADAAQKPFFLYFALPHTHAASFSSDEFRRSSSRGIYGDMVADMDNAVGKIVDEVKQLGRSKDTMVIFTADNGPMPQLCSEGGSAGPLRGGKATSLEGGIRVPGIVWWPGNLQAAGTVDERVISSLDIFPTLLDFAGVKPQTDRHYDGRSLRPLLTGQAATPSNGSLYATYDLTKEEKAALEWETHDRVLLHNCGNKLMAVRVGKYKVHYYIQHEPAPNCTLVQESGLPTYGNGSEAQTWDCTKFTTKMDPPAVYNIQADPSEKFPLVSESAVAVTAIQVAAKANNVFRHSLTVALTQTPQLGQFDTQSMVCCRLPDCVCGYENASTPFDIRRAYAK